ncbi:MAG: hypothetical protein KJ051_10630 [Thermoleophilia bacterium]|nr:hypothetical protein [Thermoleophilia bacterium]
MLRAALLIALIVALGVAVRGSGVLEELGLLGSCHTIAAPAGLRAEWQACRPGRLGDAPDMAKRSCASQGVVGAVEYWLCPLPPAGERAISSG